MPRTGECAILHDPSAANFASDVNINAPVGGVFVFAESRNDETLTLSNFIAVESGKVQQTNSAASSRNGLFAGNLSAVIFYRARQVDSSTFHRSLRLNHTAREILNPVCPLYTDAYE